MPDTSRMEIPPYGIKRRHLSLRYGGVSLSPAGRPRSGKTKVGLADKQDEVTHSPPAPTPHWWAVQRIENTGFSPIGVACQTAVAMEEIEEVPTPVTITGASTRWNRQRPTWTVRVLASRLARAALAAARRDGACCPRSPPGDAARTALYDPTRGSVRCGVYELADDANCSLPGPSKAVPSASNILFFRSRSTPESLSTGR